MNQIIKTELLENFMKEKGLSKIKFCKLCKISPNTLKKIMTNDLHFNLGILFRIAKIINVPFFQLFN